MLTQYWQATQSMSKIHNPGSHPFFFFFNSLITVSARASPKGQWQATIPVKGHQVIQLAAETRGLHLRGIGDTRKYSSLSSYRPQRGQPRKIGLVFCAKIQHPDCSERPRSIQGSAPGGRGRWEDPGLQVSHPATTHLPAREGRQNEMWMINCYYGT